MIYLKNCFKNKKVIVTGHTGFKGAWLSFWLMQFGAKVTGVSIAKTTKPSIFEVLGIQKRLKNNFLNIRNLKKLKFIVSKEKPDFIFHLAAQALVKKSYKDPIETITTNSIGTMNILENLKTIKKKTTVILITSDKSYKNLEIERGYREDDILGGYDPYSASKGAAELIIQTYLKSFFDRDQKINIGVARAGNVIGGGDWSPDRLVPDCMKSWSKKKFVKLRNPLSTRPWQHVLEAVGGYLIFAYKLNKNKKLHGEIFNFGPSLKRSYDVLTVVKTMKKFWLNVSWKILKTNTKQYESGLLKLNCDKAKKILKWKSILNFNETIEMVTNWYKMYYTDKKKIKEYSLNQIKLYEKLLKERL